MKTDGPGDLALHPPLLHFDEIDYRRAPGPWRFATDEAAAIDRHWDKLCAANPHLFNGAVFLMRRRADTASGERKILRGEALQVDYKAFLAWRDFGFPDAEVSNCFAMAALVSSDGAFMLGQMSQRTANPGRIYFPAGTPDPDDLKGESVDLEGSVLRELQEETGIGPEEVSLSPGWSVVADGPRIACMKLARSRRTAAEIVGRFNTFLAAETAPELDALLPVRSIRDLDEEQMPAFMLRYLRHMMG